MSIIKPGGGSGPMGPRAPRWAPKTKGKRKLKMVGENGWAVFEEDDKIWLSHFCSGKPNPYEKEKRAPWFHRGEDVDKTDKCSSCEQEIPKNLLMMAKINNVKYT